METYKGVNANNGRYLDGNFPITPVENLDTILKNANQAFLTYQNVSNKGKSAFLGQIALEIEVLGDALIERAMLETGLPKQRIIGERLRTTNQLRMFAEIANHGEWVEATIEEGDAARMPNSKPDLRKQLEPIGTIVVFGASNFPLAYSAGGGDVVSALAAGCSVVVKAHPAHPGTSQMVANAIQKAIEKCELPIFLYQHLHGVGFELGVALVKHPLTRAVGFTGSYLGGKTLFDIANQRKVPIPVFAEMGSTNPVLLLPNALSLKGEFWGNELAKSLALNAGQFCTNPGLIVGIVSEELDHFTQSLITTLGTLPSDCMLHKGIATAYKTGKGKRLNNKSVETIYNAQEEDEMLGGASVIRVAAIDFRVQADLREELFGPHTLIVACQNKEEMRNVVHVLEGQLTGSIIGEETDLNENKELIDLLKSKVGRIIFNGVPTGVEVTNAMHHGGPFPATTDARFTAVGPDAIKRFVRPVAYQNCPQSLLPTALRDNNTLDVFRKINGIRTKKSL